MFRVSFAPDGTWFIFYSDTGKTYEKGFMTKDLAWDRLGIRRYYHG